MGWRWTWGALPPEHWTVLELLLSHHGRANMMEKAKMSLSPVSLGFDRLTGQTHFGEWEGTLKAIYCRCAFALPFSSPKPPSKQPSSFSGDLSLQRQRLPSVNNPSVTEFLLSNLSSCNFHPLFPVICLRPRKKQACFAFYDSSQLSEGGSGRVRGICGQTGSHSLWPLVFSSVKCWL